MRHSRTTLTAALGGLVFLLLGASSASADVAAYSLNSYYNTTSHTEVALPGAAWATVLVSLNESTQTANIEFETAATVTIGGKMYTPYLYDDHIVGAEVNSNSFTVSGLQTGVNGPPKDAGIGFEYDASKSFLTMATYSSSGTLLPFGDIGAFNVNVTNVANNQGITKSLEFTVKNTSKTTTWSTATNVLAGDTAPKSNKNNQYAYSGSTNYFSAGAHIELIPQNSKTPNEYTANSSVGVIVPEPSTPVLMTLFASILGISFRRRRA